MYDFLWLVLPLSTAHAVFTAYALLKEATVRFGEAQARKLSLAPIMRRVWIRFGLKTGLAIVWMAMTALVAVLAFLLTEIFTFLFQWAEPGRVVETHGFLLAIGLITGMLALMAKKNDESLKLMKKGDLWIGKDILCRRLRTDFDEPAEKARRRR